MKNTSLRVFARAWRALVACTLVVGLAGCGAGGTGSTSGPSSPVGSDATSISTPTSTNAAGSPTTVAAKTAATPLPPSGRILVGFKAGVSEARKQQLFTATGGRRLGDVKGTSVHVMAVPPGRDEDETAETFRSMPEVKFAEPDAIVKLAMTANDPYYGSAWHLPKIAAPAAWDMTTGSSAVTVAICDTGTEATHPDLSPKLVPGWNIPSNSSDTSDINGHGTGTAGTAAAASNNGTGVTALAWQCKIMPVRVTNDATGMAYISDLATRSRTPPTTARASPT